MKRKLENYAFSNIEIRILKEVADENHSLSLLRKRLSIKPSYLSKNIKKLSQKGVIIFKKKKRTLKKFKFRKYVYFESSKHASLLRELLVAYNHIKWENILSGLGIEVLFQVLDRSEITFGSFSKVTFWRYSKEFMALGLVNFDERGYSINPRFSVLANFLTEYQGFLLNTLVKSISEKAVILWQKDFECLIRVPRKSVVFQTRFLKTATSRLDDFGIPIFSDFDIFFYSKEKKRIRAEDVILHTLLIERDNVRYVTYSLLLLKKKLREIDKEYLLKESQRLDLGLQVNAMLLFLKTKGVRRGRTLPTWGEFMAKAREYEVAD